MINLQLLKGDYTTKILICPSCNNSKLIENSIKSHNLIETKYAEPEFLMQYGFHESSYILRSSIYECEDPECKQEVILLEEEDGKLNPRYNSSNYWDVGEFIYKRRIKYMNPSIAIIAIPNDLDQKLKEILKMSFILFWIDKDSCANKIRIVLEALLDKLKVPKLIKNKSGSKRIKLQLGKRISHLEQISHKYSKYANTFKAIKWIGNVGSHSNEKISIERLIHAYQILDFLFDEIFLKKNKKIISLTKEINAKKGK